MASVTPVAPWTHPGVCSSCGCWKYQHPLEGCYVLVWYRDCAVRYDPPPIPTWKQYAYAWVHDDFDGAPDAGDHRCGNEASILACMQAINDCLDEEITEDDMRVISNGYHYQDGACFARAYARTHGIEAAVRHLDRTTKGKTEAFIAGACDTLLVLVQNVL